MHHDRVKFATQVDSALLDDLRSLARSEGRQMQALVDEAIGDLLDKRRKSTPRGRVMDAYEDSVRRYADVYRKLAE